MIADIFNEIVSVGAYVIPVMIVLLVVSLGGLFSERSGVINIALEGIMVMGGFVGAMMLYFLLYTVELPIQLAVFFALITGALVGMGFSFFHAFASVSMQSNQIISATALNLFAGAVGVFVARTVYGYRRINVDESYRMDVPFLSDIPVLGELLFQDAFLSTFIGIIILITVIILLYKTRFGLRLRSCGENPHAADSVGVDVGRMRYAGVLISGLLAGLGGVFFVVAFQNRFESDVRGFGFLALALMISGQWRPMRIFFISILFALMRVVAARADSIMGLRGLEIEPEILRILPYVMTLVVLALTSKRSKAPEAIGEPYDISKR